MLEVLYLDSQTSRLLKITLPCSKFCILTGIRLHQFDLVWKHKISDGWVSKNHDKMKKV